MARNKFVTANMTEPIATFRRINVRKAILVGIAVLTISLAACRGVEQNVSSNSPDLVIPREAMESYLAAHLLDASFGGHVFCAYDVLTTEGSNDATVFYLWTLCEEIYCEQRQLSQGSGVSLPVAVRAERQGNGLWSLDHTAPQDGPNYDQEIRTIFPRLIWPAILPASASEVAEFNRRVKTLEDEIAITAQARFETCQ